VNIDELARSHGTTRDDMMMAEMDVYSRSADDPTAEIRGMGLTQAEKTLTPGIEFMVYKRGMPAVTYVADVSAIDLKMEFRFDQFDPVNVALWLNGEIDRTNPDTDVVNLGTEPNPPSELTWWWIGELRDKRPIQFCMRRGVVTDPGALTTGNGEYTGMPISLTAYPEESICDKTADLFYVCIGKLDVPSGGFVDPCAGDVTPCEPD
jgi:hypothetical protein